jgi:serine O-acetyltransferase
VIGGNVWLTHSVPPGSNVSQGKIRERGADDAPDDGRGA